MRMGLDLVRRDRRGGGAHAFMRRHPAATEIEIIHTAIVKQHRDAVLVETILVGAARARAVADPFAALIAQHLVHPARIVGLEMVMDADLAVVVFGSDAQDAVNRLAFGQMRGQFGAHLLRAGREWQSADRECG